jgi:hypothetical protein
MKEENENALKAAFTLASGHFLTDQLPNEFDEWGEVQRLGFIEDHKWQPFEYWDPAEIYDEIRSLADTMIRFAEKYHINERLDENA